MTKADLIETVAGSTGLTKGNVKQALDGVFGAIMDALADGDRVQIPGFGTFEVRQRAARAGKNPRTGESITIPASTVPAFKAGKALKDLVKG